MKSQLALTFQLKSISEIPLASRSKAPSWTPKLLAGDLPNGDTRQLAELPRELSDLLSRSPVSICLAC